MKSIKYTLAALAVIALASVSTAKAQTGAPGDLVLVPLNRRQEVGVVWDAPSGPAVADSKLKPVSARVEAPAMPAPLRHLVDWIASYTLSPPGQVLAMALRVNALVPPPMAAGWRAVPEAEGVRLTPQRQRVLATLGDKIVPGADLARRADVGSSVIRGMADAGGTVDGDHGGVERPARLELPEMM